MDEPSESLSRVEQLEITPEFLAHMARRAFYREHRVSLSELMEVHAGNPRYFRNATGLRAPFVMVGRTAAGRILCVPIEPTASLGLWRPVTAFEANTHHVTRYLQAIEEATNE
jgi:hypothetical protein